MRSEPSHNHIINMRLSSLAKAFLVLTLLALGSGCSTIESAMVRNMTPLERNAYVLKKLAAEERERAAHNEKLLNNYLAEKRAEFASVPNDASGLRTTQLIASKADQDIRSVRDKRGDNKYTWPEMQAFANELRAVRNRQLQALRPLLADDSGKTTQEASGFQFLIHSGMFADTDNPIFHEAFMAQRRMHARRLAELQRRQDEQLNAAVMSFVKFLTAIEEAKQKAAQDLMARGICPECSGKGETTSTSENKCYTCAGTGFTYVRGGGCPVCGGLGTIGIATTSTDRCKKCRGNGKYPSQ